MNGWNRLLAVEVRGIVEITDRFRGVWESILQIEERRDEGCQRVTGWTWKH